MTTAKHKDTRFHGIQRVPGPEVEYTDRSGRTIYKGPGSGTDQTIAETYCGHCQKWIQTNGVMGPLKFMATHEDGDCQKS